jgi:hypothetical protein
LIWLARGDLVVRARTTLDSRSRQQAAPWRGVCDEDLEANVDSVISQDLLGVPVPMKESLGNGSSRLDKQGNKK